MPRERYSHNESWNRIRRLFITGSATYSYATGALDGEHESWNQAISDIAQLLNNTYPDKAPQVPNAIKATVVEAEAGTDNTKAVTPLGVQHALQANVSGLVEHGHIWGATGTSVQDLAATWLKPTGIFLSDGLSSDNITPTWGSDLIEIDVAGTYLVNLQASLAGEGDYTLKGAVYVDSVLQEGIMFEEYMEHTGSTSVSAVGTISTTGTNNNLELYLIASGGTPEIQVNTISLSLIGIPST